MMNVNVTDVKENVLEIIVQSARLSYVPSDEEELPIDSFSSVEIIVSLEEKLNITFDEDDLVLDNFLTVRSIMDLVAKGMASA